VGGLRRGREGRGVKLGERALGLVEAPDQEEAPDLEIPRMRGAYALFFEGLGASWGRSGKSKGAKPHRPISNAAGTNEPAWRLSNFEGVTGKESMA
jgi:hypothetical protein